MPSLIKMTLLYQLILERPDDFFHMWLQDAFKKKKRIMPHLKEDLCVTEINLVYNELELPL